MYGGGAVKLLAKVKGIIPRRMSHRIVRSWMLVWDHERKKNPDGEGKCRRVRHREGLMGMDVGETVDNPLTDIFRRTNEQDVHMLTVTRRENLG